MLQRAIAISSRLVLGIDEVRQLSSRTLNHKPLCFVSDTDSGVVFDHHVSIRCTVHGYALRCTCI